MSSYWDAIERTARGLAGSARPRPRTMFEDDLGSTSEGIGEVEQEIDAPTKPMRAEASPAAAELPLGNYTAKEARAAAAPEEAAPCAPSGDEATTQPPQAAAVATAAEPVGSLEQVEGKRSELAPATAEPAPKIIEVHEVESSRTVVERLVEAAPSAPSSPPAPPAAPLAPTVHEAHNQEPPTEPQAILSFTPAQPVVQEPESARGPEPPEQPPIIIEIERIDVRIEPAASPPPVPLIRKSASSAPSLHDYLSSRSGSRT